MKRPTGTVKYTIVTNGTSRVFEGKFIGDVFRVYRVYGDVSKPNELKEALQDLGTTLDASVESRM